MRLVLRQGPRSVRRGEGPAAARAAHRAAWRDAESLWQRRAAAVAFVDLAPQGDAFYRGFTRMLLTVCARNVRDDARFSQTSVGWLLRDLSQADPAAVRAFGDAIGIACPRRR